MKVMNSELNKQVEKSKTGKSNKKRAYLVMLALAIICALAFSAYMAYHMEIKQVGEQVAKALQEKYGEPFGVTDGRYISQLKTYEYKAYPTAASNFRFSVWADASNHNIIRDTYKRKKTNYEFWLMLKPYIDRISQNYADGSASIGTGGGLEVLDLAELALYDLHYNEMPLIPWIEKHKKALTMGVGAFFNMPLNIKTKQRIYQQTYELLQRLKQMEIYDINIEFRFFDMPTKDIRTIYDKYKRGIQIYYSRYYIGVLSIQSHRYISKPNNPKANKYGFVSYSDLDQIHSVKDIGKFLKEFKPNYYEAAIKHSEFDDLKAMAKEKDDE